jgi:hypothetical protein
MELMNRRMTLSRKSPSEEETTSQPKIGLVTWHGAFWGSYWGVWGPKTRFESQLKVATLHYEKLILPMSSDELGTLVDFMGKSQGFDLQSLRRAWMSLDQAAPGLDHRALMQQFYHPDEKYI